MSSRFSCTTGVLCYRGKLTRASISSSLFLRNSLSDNVLQCELFKKKGIHCKYRQLFDHASEPVINMSEYAFEIPIVSRY